MVHLKSKKQRVDADEVFTLAQLKSWSWIVYKNPKALFSYSDWCLSQPCVYNLCAFSRY